ncbi:MAG: hypothetical protein Q8P81_03810 [Nanoarchaeota archaeon]|nr:hypothetical protein [Nanoarchaeota archaeon]
MEKTNSLYDVTEKRVADERVVFAHWLSKQGFAIEAVEEDIQRRGGDAEGLIAALASFSSELEAAEILAKSGRKVGSMNVLVEAFMTSTKIHARLRNLYSGVSSEYRDVVGTYLGVRYHRGLDSVRSLVCSERGEQK